MAKVVLDYDSSFNKGMIISDMLDIIRNIFSVPNKNKTILTKKYPNIVVPSRFYAITSSGRFELGMFYEILNTLKNSQYGFELEITDKLRNEVLSPIEHNNFELPKLSLEPREFQINGINKALKYGNGVYVVGTGGGKTLLMALLQQSFYKLGKQTCLVALPAHLVIQTSKDFISYGIPETDIALWDKDNEFEIKPIVIASYKMLQAKLSSFKHLTVRKQKENETVNDYSEHLEQYKDKEKIRLKTWKKAKNQYTKKLNEIDLILLDEVHTLRKNNKLNSIISLFDTKHKFGFTGTLPEDKLDEWNIIGKIGPILENISSYELRQQGHLSDVLAQIIRINYKNPIMTAPGKLPTSAYIEECEWIYNNTYRNNIIVHFASKFTNNCLIIVDRLAHGSLLYELLTNKLPDKKVYWIRGEVENEDREAVRKLMESENNIVCVAMSKIFSTGINISNLHYIIFAQGGKAKITLIQSIGRGLRLHENKNRLIIIDLADILHYGIEHVEIRLKHYEKEKIQYELRDITEP